MKYLVIAILAIGVMTDPLKIGKINRAKSEIQEAYNTANYKEVIKKCRYLIDTLEVADDDVMLNLANAYHLSKDTAQAPALYETLSISSNGPVRSKARQQLGVIAYKKGNMHVALAHFKQAIKADPQNIDARYDYEMLKRKLDEQKRQEEKSQEFARNLKAKADALSAQGRFQEAYQLMADGAKKDARVLQYLDFTSRLKQMADINKIPR